MYTGKLQFTDGLHATAIFQFANRDSFPEGKHEAANGLNNGEVIQLMTLVGSSIFHLMGSIHL